jgi:hypothetical protein
MDFFVVGTSRSGSTLLRHMLAAHPDVAVLNESHWVPQMWEAFGAAGTPMDQLVAILLETRWESGRRVVDVNLEISGQTWERLIDGLRKRFGGPTTVAAFHDALVDEVFGAIPGSIRRGDKTPDYGFYMTLLQQIWPGARFIHVVRNGIDTARSMAKHPGCQLMISAGYDNWVPLSYGRIHEQYKRLNLPFGSYVGSWRRRMKRIRHEADALRRGTYREVRYEWLVKEPSMVARDIAGYLDLAPSASWLRQCSGLVKSKPTAEPITADTFRDLTLDDLRVLNDVGGVSFLGFPPDAHCNDLEAALRRPGPAEDALKIALGVLATRTVESHRDLADRALRLLHHALVSNGHDVGQWVVLDRSASLE